AQMVVHLFHALDIFRGDHRRLSRALLGDDATQVNDTVLDNDGEAERAPVVLLHRSDNALADVIVVSRRIGDVTGEAGDSLQQVGPRHDADDLAVANDRQPLDVVLFHQVHDLGQRRVLRDGHRVPGHDLGHLAAMLMDKIRSRLARSQDEPQPAAAFALGADFAAADEITFGDDTDELAAVHHRKTTDMSLQHEVGCLDDGRVRGDGDDRLGHDLVGAHGELRECKEFIDYEHANPIPEARFDRGQTTELAIGLTQLNVRPSHAVKLQIDRNLIGRFTWLSCLRRRLGWLGPRSLRPRGRSARQTGGCWISSMAPSASRWRRPSSQPRYGSIGREPRRTFWPSSARNWRALIRSTM